MERKDRDIDRVRISPHLPRGGEFLETLGFSPASNRQAVESVSRAW